MAARIIVKSFCFLLWIKEIVGVENATFCTKDWYRHVAGDRA